MRATQAFKELETNLLAEEVVDAMEEDVKVSPGELRKLIKEEIELDKKSKKNRGASPSAASTNKRTPSKTTGNPSTTQQQQQQRKQKQGKNKTKTNPASNVHPGGNNNATKSILRKNSSKKSNARKTGRKTRFAK